MDEATVFNTDIFGLVRRLNRAIFELIKSASANIIDMNAFDQGRLTAYIGGLRSYVAWVVAQPQLDLPESSPDPIQIAAGPQIPASMENDAIMDLVEMLRRARVELVNSQSARQSTGLITYDHNRFLSILNKAENFLNQYIKIVQPVDAPESTPRDSDTGTGRTGTNP
jgi:hypothetical protein